MIVRREFLQGLSGQTEPVGMNEGDTFEPILLWAAFLVVAVLGVLFFLGIFVSVLCWVKCSESGPVPGRAEDWRGGP